MDFEDRYEKLVYQWSDTHLAVSAALGIEFDPEGSDNRYTEAIAAKDAELASLRAQVAALKDALHPFAEAAKAIKPSGIDVMDDDQLVLDESIVKTYHLGDIVTIADLKCAFEVMKS